MPVQSFRVRYLNSIRRSFTRDLLEQPVGWVGIGELHRVTCELYLRTSTSVRVVGGPLKQVLAALAEDYDEGLVPFPALHGCLRDDCHSNGNGHHANGSHSSI